MLIEYLINGLGLGAIFAFIALGYTMVYGIIKLINFAHGEFFMVGAFAGYFCLRDLNLEYVDLPQPLPIVLDFAVAIIVAAVVAGLLAVITERLAYKPVRSAGRIAALLTAVGVSLLLQNLATQVWGADYKAFPDPRIPVALASIDGEAATNLWVDIETTTTSGDVVRTPTKVISEGDVLSNAQRKSLEADGHTTLYQRVTLPKRQLQLWVLLALVLTAPLLWFWVKRTRMGRAMRAVSEDTDAARLMGVNINLVIMLTFLVGGMLAGIGGVAYMATYGSVFPLLGFMPGLKAFIAAVIGGIGSIPGAILGGLILGVTEAVLPFFLREAGWADAFAWKDAIAFAFLIAVLIIKPTGILGKPMREKV